MGYNISELSMSELDLIFVDKIADYKDLLDNVMQGEDCKRRFRLIARTIGMSLTNYKMLKDIVDSDKGNERDRYTFIELEKYLNNILNDELEFLKFFTSSFNGNNENYGLRFQNEDGEILLNNINESMSYSIAQNILAVKTRKGKQFEYPKAMQERLDNPTQYVFSFDEAAVDLPKIFGNDIYKCFFTGDGQDFYYLLLNYFTDDEIRILDKAIDKKDDSYHDLYSDLMAKANSKKSTKKL